MLNSLKQHQIKEFADPRNDSKQSTNLYPSLPGLPTGPF